MPTQERPTEGTKEKAAEGTNEGKPAALTDLPDELLTMVVKSAFKTGEAARLSWAVRARRCGARCVG